MKRILAIICLLLTPVLLMGCGNNSNGKNGENGENNQTASEPDGSVPKSEDLYSFEISLNGKLYTLPEDFSEFEKNGWTIEKRKSDKIAPKKEMVCVHIKNGDAEAEVDLFNNDLDELPINKCKVGTVIVGDSDIETGTDITLPKGIKIRSTKDEIIKAYGEPTESEEITPEYKDAEPFTALSYRIQGGQSIEFNISNESNKITQIELKNLVQDEDKSTAKKDSSSKNDSGSNEIPESVTKYEAPKEFSNDLNSFNIKYDGVLYSIPALVAEFEKNGWKVVDAPELIAARDYKFGVILQKDNKNLSVIVYNDSPNATSAENCFVAGIMADEYLKKIPLELPKGITIGSSKDDVDKAYSDCEVKKDSPDDNTSGIEIYKYEKDRNKSIQLTIDKKTNSVAMINIESFPQE